MKTTATATTSSQPPAASVNAVTGGPTPLGQTLRLYRSEMRLFFREAQSLVFVFAFPVVTVLVLGGVFGSDNTDSGFEFVKPSDFYIAAYFGVMLSGIGLIMLSSHVAGYRESGVLRRFDTAGFPKWSFAAAQFLSGITMAVLGSIALLLAGELAYGLPALEDPPRTILGLVVGTLAFISFGVAFGSLMPTARAASAMGMTLFFPMFLLAGGGPPPEALSDTMRSIANWLPLTHVIRASQEPWLGLGTGGDHLVIVIGILVVSTAVWVWRGAYVSGNA